MNSLLHSAGLVKSGRKLKVDIYKPKVTAAQLPTINDPTIPDITGPDEPYSNDHLNDKTAASSHVPRPTDPVADDTADSTKTYHRGQQLGNETRMLEFKKAGGDLQKHLKKHLAKYICAFLNSQGGTLMLGVDDTGMVSLFIFLDNCFTLSLNVTS